MNEYPSISVILPVFNAEKYLKDCIESILEQTLNDFELIIINDGSTDNSISIIESYMKQDDRIILISRKNYGLVETLNDGLRIAKGKYIARMDSDDIARNDRLEKQYDYLETNRDITVVGSLVKVIGDCSEDFKAKALKKYNYVLNDNNQESFLLKIGLVCHPTIMFKRDIIYSFGMYRDKYYTSEDYDFYLRLLKKGAKFRILQEELLTKREHMESKSSIERKNYISLQQWISIRLDYLEDRIDLNRDVVIWGASNAGILVKDIIEIRYPKCRVKFFLDRSKTGVLEGVEIISSEKIYDFQKEFIICASQPGKVEIEEILLSLGLQEFKQYLILV
jgi:glycosyltransferase involved in cell wall biosynthesis